jgi:hypothetical protein
MKIGFGLNDQNMHAISFSVTQNRTLKEIDFSANAFGDAGLESLCDGANLFFLSYASRYLTIPGIDGCKTITSVRLDKVNCTVKGSVCHHLIILTSLHIKKKKKKNAAQSCRLPTADRDAQEEEHNAALYW